MTARAAIAAAMLVLPVLWGGGCSEKPMRLQEMVRDFTGPPEELDWVDDQDPDKRRQAIAVLSSDPRYLQEPYTKFYALTLTNDSDALVRAAAARALGLAGDPTYLPQLVAALEHASPVVRCDAAWALNRMTDESALAPLTRHATQDSCTDVRAACCRALGHYTLPQVSATLIRALGDPDLNVRRRAQATLKSLAGVDVGERAEDWSAYLEHEAQGGQ